MKRLTNFLVVFFIKDHQNIKSLKVRSEYGSLEGWVSILVNIVLFAIKLWAGISVKSISLIADAVHTLSDSITSAVIIIGFKVARKPSDKEHPFGHGRMESIAALVVSVLLFVTGFELLRTSFHHIFNPIATTVPYTVIVIITATLIVKHMLSRFSYILGDIIDSAALKADAAHHTTDVFSTGLVVVALIASRFGIYNMDGIMGMFVSLIIFYAAYVIAKDAVTPLLGEPPSRESLNAIETIAKSHEGVLGVHDIIYNSYGSHCIISLHIEVSDKKQVTTLHTLSEHIEEAIQSEFGGMVIVHLDPINKDHPQYNRVKETISNIIVDNKQIISFHELRIVGEDPEKCNIVFDLATNKDLSDQENYDIVKSVKTRFLETFPKMKISIKIEPMYVYNL
ncbi:MAG: cation transporter [Fibrobacteria bacterium]|nr:cation transporter [Fibrobacteria bacterium]